MVSKQMGTATSALPYLRSQGIPRVNKGKGKEAQLLKDYTLLWICLSPTRPLRLYIDILPYLPTYLCSGTISYQAVRNHLKLIEGLKTGIRIRAQLENNYLPTFGNWTYPTYPYYVSRPSKVKQTAFDTHVNESRTWTWDIKKLNVESIWTEEKRMHVNFPRRAGSSNRVQICLQAGTSEIPFDNSAGRFCGDLSGWGEERDT